MGQWRRRGQRGFCAVFLLWYNHFVRASRDIIVAPFDDDSVTTLVLDGVGDVIELVTHVLDVDFLAGSVGSMHAHHQHVGTWMKQQDDI